MYDAEKKKNEKNESNLKIKEEELRTLKNVCYIYALYMYLT